MWQHLYEGIDMNIGILLQLHNAVANSLSGVWHSFYTI